MSGVDGQRRGVHSEAAEGCVLVVLRGNRQQQGQMAGGAGRGRDRYFGTGEEQILIKDQS